MKFIAIFFIFNLILLSNVFCQREWAPLGAVWYYTWGDVWGPPVEYLRMESIQDTLVDGKNSRLLKSIISHDTTLSEVEKTHLEDIIIYQDGYKIYRWVEDQFRILYDFSLKLGDTLKVYIPEDERTFSRMHDSTAYFVIDSIETLTLGGELILSQYLKPLDKGASDHAVGFGDWAYESIGSRTYFRPFPSILCDAKCPWPLRCYIQQDFSHKWFDIPCDTIVPFVKVGIEKQLLNDQVEVYPNPAQINNYLSLDIKIKQANTVNKANYIIYLVDVMGKKYQIDFLFNHINHIYLEPTMFLPGIYHLIIENNKQPAYSKNLIFIR